MQAFSIALALASGIVLTFAPDAQARRGRGLSYVPPGAWNAVRETAKQDLGGSRVTPYKTGWSRSLSRGLLTPKGGRAWVVLAWSQETKRKGVYLVSEGNPVSTREKVSRALAAEKTGKAFSKAVRAPQVEWNVTPLEANTQGAIVSTVDAKRPGSVYALVQQGRRTTKVAHGLRIKNVEIINRLLGDTLASKRSGKESLLLIRGYPNSSNIHAAAQLEFLKAAGGGKPPQPDPSNRKIVGIEFLSTDPKQDYRSKGWLERAFEYMAR